MLTRRISVGTDTFCLMLAPRRRRERRQAGHMGVAARARISRGRATRRRELGGFSNDYGARRTGSAAISSGRT